jgi:DNA invertase Pin-like site-specific DNA recombinase
VKTSPPTAIGQLLFNVLGMVVEFEADQIKVHTRERMKNRQGQGRASATSSPRGVL